MKRVNSSLVPDPSLELSAKQQKSGFYGLFIDSKSLNPKLFMRLWLSSVYPDFINTPEFGAVTGSARIALDRAFGDGDLDLIRVKRLDDGYEVMLPQAVILDMREIPMIATCMAQPKAQDARGIAKESFDQAPPGLWNSVGGNDFVDDIQFTNDFIPPVQKRVLDEGRTTDILGREKIVLVAPSGLPNYVAPSALIKTCAVKDISCLRGLVCETSADMSKTVVYLKFFINIPECQYLVNTPWRNIRDIDVFNTMVAWGQTKYGAMSKPAPVSFSLNDIAAGIPEDVEKAGPRLSPLGLSLSEEGDLYWLPKALDRVPEYEESLEKANVGGDGWFTLQTLGAISQRSFKSKPILMDWVNAKFVYATMFGTPDILDLGCFREPSPASYMEVLSKQIDTSNFIRQVFGWGISNYKLALDITPEERSATMSKAYVINAKGEKQKLSLPWAKMQPNPAAALNSVIPYAEMYMAEDAEKRRFLSYWDLVPNGRMPSLEIIGKRLVQVLRAIEADPLPLEKAGISPVTVAKHVGLLKVFALAFEDPAGLAADDIEFRKVAISQGEDPDFKGHKVPLIADGCFRIPHQFRAANKTRKAPQLVIYGVAAGGGKSLMNLLDAINTQIQHDQDEPFLLACPGGLMAQYIQEVNFFFHGRINVIPVCSASRNRHGLGKLGALIAAAPKNTMVLLDMDFARLDARTMYYAGRAITHFPAVSFLRQFAFQTVLVDESHYLKNTTNRSQSVLELITDIPFKRIASATLAFDSPSDLAGQVRLMEPSIFGTRDSFNRRFAASTESIRGDRVIEWKKGAGAFIKKAIWRHIVYVEAGRKEWAALLPPVDEQFLRVDLTDAQREVYQALLEATLDEIKKDKELMKRLKGSDDEEEGSSDSDLASLLRPYLARLEKFVSNPGGDELGYALKGKDKVSPKVAVLEKRLRRHLKANRKKAVIFCAYVDTTTAVYENLPDDLKEMTLLYRAENKVKHIREFAKNPKYKFMVGVEASINTGRNFQFADYLIRYEHGYTPGALEQGASRFIRPDLKISDDRKGISIDWLVANKTIDVTKVARLISKLVSVAKYENSAEVSFQALPEVEVIKMTLDNIAVMNDWETSLAPYASVYAKYHEALETMYEEYRQWFIKTYGNKFKFTIKSAGTPVWAKTLPGVPLIPGSELFGSEKLGLIRLDQALADKYGDEAIDPRKNTFVGRRVYTDLGVGELKRINNVLGTTSVAFVRGQQAFKSSEIFVVPRDMRDPEVELLEARGLEILPRVSFKEVKARAVKRAAVKLDLGMRVVNGQPQLFVKGEVKAGDRPVLNRLGFKQAPQFYRSPMTGSKTIKRILQHIKDNKLRFGVSESRDALESMAKVMQVTSRKVQDVLQAVKPLKLAVPHEFPVRGDGATTINIYPVAVNKSFYVYAVKGVGNNALMEQSIKNVEWEDLGPQYVLQAKSVKKLRKVLEALFKDPDIEVDKARLTKAYKLIRG